MYKQLLRLKSFQGILSRMRCGRDDAPQPEKAAFSGPEALTPVAGELERAMTGSETDFLRLGENLQQLYAEVDALTQATVASASTMKGDNLESSFLGVVDQLARRSMAALENCKEEVEAHLSMIGSSMTELDQLCRICPVIEKAGMSLNVIGLNIAVECSRSPETREMFGAFIEEIRSLAIAIAEISTRIFEDSHRTRTTEADAHQKILGALDQFSALYARAEGLVGTALGDIQQVMDLFISVLQGSIEKEKQVARIVGEVVMAIQFHDIARQRMEHLCDGLREAEVIVSGRSGEPGDGGGGDEIPVGDMAAASRIFFIQMAQLREIIDEINQTHARCDAAFDQLTALVAELKSDATAFSEEGQEKTGMAHRIHSLREGLIHLDELLGRGDLLKQQIWKASKNVSGTAAKLTEHIDEVRRISQELHLKALNAIIKSARVGEEGRALEVLAQEVSRLSQESDSFVGNVVDILARLGMLANQAATDGGNREAAVFAESGSIGVGIDKMSGIYADFKDDTQKLGDRYDHLLAELTRVREHLGFMPALARFLVQRLDRLDSIGEDLDLASRLTAEGDTQQLIRMADRYTMESERRLHQAVIGDRHAAPPATAGEAPVLFDLSEPFNGDGSGEAAGPFTADAGDAGGVELFDTDAGYADGVELFDTDPGDAAGVELFDTDAGDAGGVELFDTDADDAGGVELFDAPDPEADLGTDSGVELFDSEPGAHDADTAADKAEKHAGRRTEAPSAPPAPEKTAADRTERKADEAPGDAEDLGDNVELF